MVSMLMARRRRPDRQMPFAPDDVVGYFIVVRLKFTTGNQNRNSN
jgi:hypothetical protein